MSRPGAVAPVVERYRDVVVVRRPDVPAETVLSALVEPGETVKRSRRALTRRVRGLIVKQVTDEGLAASLRRSICRRSARRPWEAALYLEARGVRVPRPLAWVEWGRWGLVRGYALLLEDLSGYVTVEEHAAGLASGGSEREDASGFLGRLADAVNALGAAQAYHADLSGKNILTRDGTQFAFIDLDGVRTGAAYARRHRLRNHVQLYDSFCDLWDDGLLEPFLAAMLPPGEARSPWLARVRAAQLRRRRRTLKHWAEARVRLERRGAPPGA